MWAAPPGSATGLTRARARVHSRPRPEPPMPLLALPFPAIDPVAVAIGPFAVRWYALAYIAGLIGGWLYARRLVLSEGLWVGLKRPTTNDLDDLIVWVALGVVLGGRVGYVLRSE